MSAQDTLWGTISGLKDISVCLISVCFSKEKGRRMSCTHFCSSPLDLLAAWAWGTCLPLCPYPSCPATLSQILGSSETCPELGEVLQILKRLPSPAAT